MSAKEPGKDSPDRRNLVPPFLLLYTPGKAKHPRHPKGTSLELSKPQVGAEKAWKGKAAAFQKLLLLVSPQSLSEGRGHRTEFLEA